jgi:hypothetical protein
MLTHAYLRKILHYSVITGDFYYLKSTARRIKIGDIAGSLENTGYKRVKINSEKHQSHRLAWFWVTGEWPEKEVDHKNGITDANQWLNLREATHSQNMCNRSINLNSTSGYKGVSWDNASQKWHARIGLNKKRKSLGYFDNIDDAYAERQKAEKALHGGYTRL